MMRLADRRFAVGLLVLVTLFAACARSNEDNTPGIPDVVIPFRRDAGLDLVRNGIAYKSLDVEIADDDSARVRGMMQRDGFPENTGMLFIFPIEEPQTFWMANTPVALDIVFANADSEIVSIQRYTRPLSPENVASEKPARFVLEVPAGFVDSYGVIESDRLTWDTEK